MGPVVAMQKFTLFKASPPNRHDHWADWGSRQDLRHNRRAIESTGQHTFEPETDGPTLPVFTLIFWQNQLMSFGDDRFWFGW